MESIFVQLIANSICGGTGLTIIQPADGADKVGPIVMRFVHEWVPVKAKEDEMRLKYDVVISTAIQAHLIDELVQLIVGYCPITEQDFIHLIQADIEIMNVINTRLIKGPTSKALPGHKRVLVVTGSVDKFITDMIYKRVYASSNDIYMDMGTLNDVIAADRVLAGVAAGGGDTHGRFDSQGFVLHINRRHISNDGSYTQLMSLDWDVMFIHNDGYYDDAVCDKTSASIKKRLTDIPATMRYSLSRQRVASAAISDNPELITETTTWTNKQATTVTDITTA